MGLNLLLLCLCGLLVPDGPLSYRRPGNPSGLENPQKRETDCPFGSEERAEISGNAGDNQE